MITRTPGKNNATTKPADEVQVTFTVAPGQLPAGQAVSVVGDFNAWDPAAHPLKPRAADGALHTTLMLPAGRRYAFRYLGEDGRWYNDEAADDYEPNGAGQQNCILDLTHLPAAPPAAAPPAAAAAPSPAPS